MEELDRKPNRGNTIFWSILFALVLAIFVGVSVYFGHDRIAESINPEKENVSQEPQIGRTCINCTGCTSSQK